MPAELLVYEYIRTASVATLDATAWYYSDIW
jgi:hypothetical protein